MKKIIKFLIFVGLIVITVFAYNKSEENAYKASLMIDWWEKAGMDEGLRNGEVDGYNNRHNSVCRNTDNLTKEQETAYRENYRKGYEKGWELGREKCNREKIEGIINNTQSSKSKKTHFSELEFRKGQKYAYKNGEAFSGTAWSSDEKSFSMTADGGVVIGAKAYHSNGRVAIDGDPVNKIRTHYDEYGNVMSEAEFKSKYPHIMQKVKAFSYEIKEID